jgi:hypothetical protein
LDEKSSLRITAGIVVPENGLAEIRGGMGNELVKKESKAWERTTLWINDMDHCPTRYGERKNGHRGVERIEKGESFFSFPPCLCASVAYI